MTPAPPPFFVMFVNSRIGNLSSKKSLAPLKICMRNALGWFYKQNVVPKASVR